MTVGTEPPVPRELQNRSEEWFKPKQINRLSPMEHLGSGNLRSRRR